MSEKIYVVTEQEAGQRLDQFLKEASGLTRSEVQKWIKDGRALLADGKMIRPNYHVQTGDQISFSWEEKKEIFWRDIQKGRRFHFLCFLKATENFCWRSTVFRL